MDWLGFIVRLRVDKADFLMSFHIAFQCKKYRGSVGAGEIRDFRGATVGRSDRGLFITTGTFTKGAIEEANRDGVPPIDLIDGEQLADKLKELELGVKTELVEKVTLKPEWFLSL
ncbi:restriction endonuclease [Aliidiomarina celeris]|uniref:restriction endonuclease n=1 Tax=Aliidiomarina celeris TaxID=2249428 RepID=UPI001E4C15F0|nr:restriction endonuclease [Aliidiomarina celeris]